MIACQESPLIKKQNGEQQEEALCGQRLKSISHYGA